MFLLSVIQARLRVISFDGCSVAGQGQATVRAIIKIWSRNIKEAAVEK